MIKLEQIQIKKILASFTQPRRDFNKEKIKELAESILSNGLINPIIVRKWKGGRFMIVAGERRWRAHKLAGLKTIQGFVKEYKKDIDWQVESLVENWQREDLTSVERENNVYALWKTGMFKTQKELAIRLGANSGRIGHIINAKEFRDKTKLRGAISTRTIEDTEGIEDKDRKKLLKQVEIGKVKADDVREVTRTIKKAPKEVKEALLSDEIDTEQAERISKLKTEQQREKAIQEHKSIKMIDKNIEKNITNQITAKKQREFDEKLIQSKNWIQSFRNSVTDSKSQIEKTIKILLLSTRFIQIMDEEQKKDLDIQIDRLTEFLDRGKQLAEQIQNKL